MTFILENYPAISAFLASITGILALGVTLYSKHRDSNIREKELQLQQSQFDLEKKHQISKEKYQQLFDEKIDVYRKLYDVLNSHRKSLFDVGFDYDYETDGQGYFAYKELTEDKVFIDSLKEVFKLIENNHFLVSDEVWQQYKKVFELYRKETAEFVFLNSVGAYAFPKEQSEAWTTVQKNVFKNHKQNIEKLFALIEDEIKRIKAVIKD